jgi:hypothetical protein
MTTFAMSIICFQSWGKHRLQNLHVIHLLSILLLIIATVVHRFHLAPISLALSVVLTSSMSVHRHFIVITGGYIQRISLQTAILLMKPQQMKALTQEHLPL